MPVNKVEYFGNTLLDLTGDNVTPGDVKKGVVFHDATGAQRVGEAEESIGTKVIMSENEPSGLDAGDDWDQIITVLEAPEEMFPPEPAAVTITGTGNSTYCYVTINGTKYSSAASGIQVMPGDAVTFGVYGRSTSYRGTVTIDGAQVLNVTNQQTQTYNWTIPEGTKTISISMSYTSTSSQRRGTITVTTTK